MNVNDYTTADTVFGYPVVKIIFHLQECPSEKKILTHTSFNTTLINYMSRESLINEVYDKNTI